MAKNNSRFVFEIEQLYNTLIHTHTQQAQQCQIFDPAAQIFSTLSRRVLGHKIKNKTKLIQFRICKFSE